MPYVLGIDIGGTSTSAAVSRLRGTAWTRPEVVQLDARSAAVPSVLHLGANGSLLVGEPERHSGGPDGGQIARGFWRRIGDDVPLMVGGEACSAQTLTAVLAMWIVEQVVVREGGHPESIVLSHPAGWGPYRRELLLEALWDIGLTNVTLLPEPVTVAESHAARGFTGATAAVYSLGGDSFEASLVRQAQHAGFEPFGFPQGLEPAGGVDFDEALADHVRTVLARELDRKVDPTAPFALLGLARECARAKQDLTMMTETDIVVRLPRGPARVPVTRVEFEDMIRPAVQVTVDLLARTVRSAGLAPNELDAVLLAGGSARIPLVTELLAAQFPVPIEVQPDAQATAATGAALAACQIVSPPQPRRRPEPGRPGRPGQTPELGAGGREPAVRSDRPGDQLRTGRGEPPPRPPVRVSPLELPAGNRLIPGRGRGRGRG
ncbi:Hsp70 family protein [Micromonospora sp. NPDC049559]|uniref:Hsp70 family protein n=1 Tax=Micromonospora sp. NPDC049559 TaxID=3155923 RepID=UPI003437891A